MIELRRIGLRWIWHLRRVSRIHGLRSRLPMMINCIRRGNRETVRAHVIRRNMIWRLLLPANLVVNLPIVHF